MNEFTHGNWEVYGDWGIKVDGVNGCILTVEHFDQKPWWALGNLYLIATAGTTATKLAEAGYDALECIEALPELMRVIDNSGEMQYILGRDIEEFKENHND